MFHDDMIKYVIINDQQSFMKFEYFIDDNVTYIWW